MRISVGSDHRGHDLRARVIKILNLAGHEVDDVGPDSDAAVDYPDVAATVSEKVVSHEADRGILICGSGIGMAITANKFSGIRATTALDELTAEMCRRHNDVNVLCLSGDRIGNGPVEGILHAWLDTEFEGGRHSRRLEKISQIEKQKGCG